MSQLQEALRHKCDTLPIWLVQPEIELYYYKYMYQRARVEKMLQAMGQPFERHGADLFLPDRKIWLIISPRNDAGLARALCRPGDMVIVRGQQSVSWLRDILTR